MARNKKHINDKFYTNHELVDQLLTLVDLDSYDLIIEPSAGSGAFSNNLRNRNLISLDIDPEADYIVKQNWLEFKLNKYYNKILVVGNPPFGNQGGLAIRFIKKSIEIGADTIAFILPKSFKKESVKNKIPLNYILQKEIDLEDNSFTLNGNPYKVPCVFQIWKKSDTERQIKLMKSSTDIFSFVKKSDEHDFAFRRVGFYAGRIYTETDDKSTESHYFIKCNIDLERLMSIINSIKWEHNNTSGPRSIGKKELIEKVESMF